MTTTLSLTRPDDWHLHLRDGEALRAVLPHTARQFARAIVMPNLKPPITTTALALDYRRRILDALPEGADFEPLMTLYLTDRTPPDEMRRAREAGIVALKLYPAGATTNSDAGVTDIRKTYATLEAMQREGLLLLVHGEVTDTDIDLFDREAVFIDRVLRAAAARLPRPEDRLRAHHHARGGAVRGRERRAPGGDDHRAPPAVQPQRHLPRRAAAALLLPAGAQARGASPRAGGGRHLGLAEVLSRHRQRAACGRS